MTYAYKIQVISADGTYNDEGTSRHITYLGESGWELIAMQESGGELLAAFKKVL